MTTLQAESLSFNPVDNERLARLCGPLDENLKQVEMGLDVVIQRRGEQLRVRGEHAKPATEALARLYLQAATQPLSIDDVQLCLVEMRQLPLSGQTQPQPSPVLVTRRGDLRGRTLNHAFIILDEAQNTTSEQMKMFLTRIGFGSKAVITGDVTQIDLARHQKSGLVQIESILSQIRGIHFHHFHNDDVIRHPLVQKIVDAYDQYQSQQEQ